MKTKLALTSCALALSIQSAYANEENEIKLEKQVITATTTSHDTLTAPASVTLINGDELRAQNHSTIAEALEETTGISLQSSVYGRQDIRIRGMESNYALVLINGQRTSSSNALIRGNDFDLSSFPMGSVERIEVIRGPMSSLYGSDALGGVINIITKKAVTTEETVNENALSGSQKAQSFNAGVETEFTQQQEGEGGDQQRISAYASGNLVPNRLSASVSFEQSNRDAWKPFEGAAAALDGLEENDKQSVKANFDVRLNKQQSVSVDVSASKDERLANWFGGGAVQTNEQSSDRQTVSLNHTGQWNFGQSQIKVLNEVTEIDDASTLYAVDTRTTDGTAQTKQTNTIFGALVNTEVNGHLVSAGTQIQKTELTSDRDLPNGDSVNEAALFVQDELFVSNVALTLGVRAENHEDYGTFVSPRAYAVYEMDSGLVLKGGVGTGFKAPELVQTSRDYNLISCRGACYLTGNPDLDPETNTAYELSLAFEGSNFGLTGGLFYNEVKDKLFRDSSTAVGEFNGLPTIQYINLDSATYQGVELEAWADLSNNLSLSANYTFTDAKDDTTDERLTYVPLQQSNVKLAYQPIESLNTFVKYRFIGQQEINTGRAPSYNIVDLGAQLTAYKGLKLKAGVNNINNVVLSEESDVFVAGGSYVEQGRSVYAGVAYDF